ncbi:hypothetical protein [Sphingopyxis sp. BSNA05]|uniref:hypothetical protein n=1 Tax=Sphingopyxis sp. BSNA05 TaxID=1236614 RepID=UPI00156497DE|nr:hypothetical protein [Sphingopyxis sp. BSNA05]
MNSASAEGFVPDGWYLEKSVEGDLDKDGLPDLAIIIRQNDPELVIEGNGFGADQYDGNPRTIVVALKQTGGGYLRIAQNDQIIPVTGGAMFDDPIDNASDGSLTIDKGVIRLNIGFWASAGTWDMFNRTFSFRLKGAQLGLIGYDNHHVHRGSGALNIVSINYLTWRKKTESGSIEDDHVPEVWSRISRKPLILFDDIGSGYEFDPDKTSLFRQDID